MAGTEVIGGQIIWNLDIDSNKFTRGLDDAQNKVDSLGDNINKTGKKVSSFASDMQSSFSSIADGLGKILVGAGALAVGGSFGFLAMAKASWDQVSAVQQATITLKAYEKDAGKVEQVLSGLVKYARSDLGVLFNRQELFAAAQGLKIMGDNTNDLVGHVEIMSRSVGLGMSTWDDLGRIIGRVGSTGVLTGIDFDNLTKAGYRLDTSLRNENISFKELFKQLDKGMPADALAGQANTIVGLNVKLQTAFRNLGAAILGVDRETAQFTKGGLGANLVQALDKLRKSLGDPVLVVSFQKMGKAIADFATIAIPLVIEGFKWVVNNMDTVVAGFASLVAMFVAAKAAAIGFALAAAPALILPTLIAAAIIALVGALVFLELKFGFVSKSLQFFYDHLGVLGFKGDIAKSAIDLLGKSFEKVGGVISSVGEFFGIGTKKIADQVKDMGEKSAAEVIRMTTAIEKNLIDLSISGGKITKDMSNQMTQSIQDIFAKDVVAINQRSERIIADLTYLKDTAGFLTADTYNQMVKTTQQKGLEQIEAQKEIAAEVSAQIIAMKNAGIVVTEEMRTGITEKVRQLRDDSVTILTDNAVKQKVIMEQLKAENGRISSEMLSSLILDANKIRDDSVKAAQDRYTKEIETIIRLRDESKTITGEQAATMIAGSRQIRDETIKHAEEQRSGVINQYTSMAGEAAKQVDLMSGKILTQWDILREGTIKKYKEIEDALRTTYQNMKNEIDSWKARFREWGENIARSFADGFGKLGDWLKDKAIAGLNSVKKFLQGQSPPVAGPFKDIDKWGFNVGSAWVEGMRSAIGGFSVPAIGAGLSNQNYSSSNFPDMAGGGGITNNNTNAPVFNFNLGTFVGTETEKRQLAKTLQDAYQDYLKGRGQT